MPASNSLRLAVHGLDEPVEPFLDSLAILGRSGLEMDGFVVEAVTESELGLKVEHIERLPVVLFVCVDQIVQARRQRRVRQYFVQLLLGRVAQQLAVLRLLLALGVVTLQLPLPLRVLLGRQAVVVGAADDEDDGLGAGIEVLPQTAGRVLY